VNAAKGSAVTKAAALPFAALLPSLTASAIIDYPFSKECDALGQQDRRS
jgi:hypothetical protein